MLCKVGSKGKHKVRRWKGERARERERERHTLRLVLVVNSHLFLIVAVCLFAAVVVAVVEALVAALWAQTGAPPARTTGARTTGQAGVLPARLTPLCVPTATCWATAFSGDAVANFSAIKAKRNRELAKVTLGGRRCHGIQSKHPRRILFDQLQAVAGRRLMLLHHPPPIFRRDSIHGSFRRSL